MTASLYLLFDSTLSERRGKDVWGKEQLIKPTAEAEIAYFKWSSSAEEPRAEVEPAA